MKKNNMMVKTVLTVAMATMMAAMCVGCGSKDTQVTAEITVEDVAEEATVAEEAAPEEVAETTEATELVTYDFETYDGDHVVIDASNITVQEKTDDPEGSSYITAEAANNVIAPGRDYVYMADDNNYYVADYANGLITVATKGDESSAATDENPGAFDTDKFSVSYDTDKFYGYVADEEAGTVILNYTGECAGTTLMQISPSDCASAEEALAEVAKTTGFELADTNSVEVNGCDVTYTWHVIPNGTDGVIVDDFYKVYVKGDNVVLIDIMTTRDSDDSRAEEISYLFDDISNTIELK